MPRGVYHRLRADGGIHLVESFDCAAEPSGWRYASVLSTVDGLGAGSVDLTVDSRGQALRVTLRSAEWQLRGGVSGAQLMWVRRPVVATNAADVTEHRQTATGFIGGSPAFLVAAAMAGSDPDRGCDLRLVGLTDSLGARLETERWQRTGRSPLHEQVEVFRRVDLSTGVVTEVHLAGDVVLDAPGVELVDLDSPPGRR